MNGDYTPELECARQAALHAGVRLRRAFHSGAGHHGGDLDAQVEADIRQQLLAHFPQHGYLGPTGAASPERDASGHQWRVDPHDGASAAQRGFRGAAVCIALLREGEPVLGVVYAYCAPDDEGDLISWACGTGPLQRNGRPVLPGRSSPPDTILVSHQADHAPLEHAMRVAPLRFRTVAGFSYRLALTAAGEARAAISTVGPVGMGSAAGHALLTGAGMDLLDMEGQPVRHDREGTRSSDGCCYGGQKALIRQLAAQSWTCRASSRYLGAEEPALCSAAPGCTVPDSAMLARAQGCLLGQLAGDALGGLVEFQTAEAILAAYPEGVRELVDGGTWETLAGQPTDDSEMALMLARSILKAGRYDAEAAARAYAWWYGTPPFDIGITTATALSAAAQAMRNGTAAAPAARSAALVDSQANGALMRVSPLGILGAGAPLGAAGAWAAEDALLTHPHPVCQHASRVFTETLAAAIRGGDDAQALHRFALDAAAQPGTPAGIREALLEAATSPPAHYSKNMGWVRIALHNAFWQLLHAPSLEEGIVSTVMAGGDTDTNAAIAGALLGAVHGRKAIPLQWLDRLLTCRPLQETTTQHPRPEGFWPVDTLCLAERLLWLGGNLR